MRFPRVTGKLGSFLLCLSILLISSAFISSVSKAAPVGPDPKINKPKSNVDEGPTQSTSPLRPMDVGTPQDEPPSDTDSYFYKYQSNVAINLGSYLMEDGVPNTIIYGLLGVTYLWYSPYLTHFETGIEQITSVEGHVWTMIHVYSNGTGRWRPFYGYGLGLRVIPQNGLATFLQWSDFYARGAYGVEYGTEGRQSWRGEVSANIDFQGHPFVTLTVGYSLGI